MKKNLHPTSVRLDDEELKLLQLLAVRFSEASIGRISRNDVVRLAIRKLAESEQIAAEASAESGASR